VNTIAIETQDCLIPSWTSALENYALLVLDELGKDGWELSVLLCSDRVIKELNFQYRGIAEATDVLSFELGAQAESEDGKRFLAGDIVISLDTLRENSEFFKISEDEELRRLLIHGILHLCGMDHATNDPAEPMIKVQEDILNKLEKAGLPSKGKEK
jgi:probable rRNA maturation factor